MSTKGPSHAFACKTAVSKINIQGQLYFYSPNQPLGQGAFSTVYKTITTSLQTHALKIIHSPLTQKERKVLDRISKLNHPNIIKVEKLTYSDEGAVIVSELCEQSLLARMRRTTLTQQQIWRISLNLLQALQFLQKQNIVHRDIKPQNVLLLKNQPKLIDFGFAEINCHSNTHLSDFVGTLLYAAPQIILHKPYTRASDVWSFGVMLYQMSFGALPWGRQRTKTELINNILSMNFHLPQRSGRSRQLIQMIKSCLNCNPQQRPRFGELLRRVRWVMGGLGRDRRRLNVRRALSVQKSLQK